jgi:hypothetical protein
VFIEALTIEAFRDLRVSLPAPPSRSCGASRVLAEKSCANRFELAPPGGLWRKDTVYGLNGHRANFVIALSLGAYDHAI